MEGSAQHPLQGPSGTAPPQTPSRTPSRTLLSRADRPTFHPDRLRRRAASTGHTRVQPTTDISGRPQISNPVSLHPGFAVATGNYKYGPDDPKDTPEGLAPPEPAGSHIHIHHHHDFPPDANMLAYAGLPAPMDHSLHVLSAEQYDDGTGVFAARMPPRQLWPQEGLDQIYGLTNSVEPRGAQGQKITNASRSVSGGRGRSERRRKKMKPSEKEELDEDEGARKVRGRPRVETKDETTADRRRTQIRLAQRAYRNRKEATILSLEKQVQELRGVAEEMGNIFLSLHDFAVCKGLLQREPEFGNQLRSTTARFLALTKTISADENSTEEALSVDGIKQVYTDPNMLSSLGPESRAPTPQENLHENRPSLGIPPWRYQINHEPGAVGGFEFEQQNFLSSAPQENRQVISRETLDNTNFSFDYLDDLRQYRVEIPHDPEAHHNIFDHMDILPPVKTLSQHETSFSRQLQRSASEQAYRIITSKSTPPSLLNQIFGFCLQFESQEYITKKLRKVLDATSKDPLYNWSAPFVHLGGSGTYYPPNENISGTPTPRFQSGMSMGPFSPPVVTTRENLMENEFRIALPGFEGDFFDSNDVEKYLQSRGINITSNSDFVTVDLNELSMSIYHNQSPRSARSESGHSTGHSPKTPQSLENLHMPGLGAQASSPTGIDALIADSNDVNLEDFSASLANYSTKPTSNPFGLTRPSFNSTPIPLLSQPKFLNRERQIPNTRVVTLNVTILIEELIKHGICIGRGAGFRPSDVDSAIVMALKRSS